MSRSLRTCRAATTFFSLEERVVGLVPAWFLRASAPGAAVGFVAEFREDPGAGYRAQSGLGPDDSGVRAPAAEVLDLPAKEADLLVQGDRQRDKSAHRVGMGRGHSGGLAQVLGTQYGLISVAPSAMSRPRAHLRTTLICVIVSFAAAAGSVALASSSTTSGASGSSNASSAAGK
ncbi:hypothetical protein ACFXPV_32740 [Streptomyces sp. NPDC059118]|uniref:hypothetical protein n=1 Tax=unclassified Streptomyces TaxID=2593676 RepID=UPI0036AF85E6